VDALLQNWEGENNWIVSPFSLIKRVVVKLVERLVIVCHAFFLYSITLFFLSILISLH
jgi:hypothetical protein